MTLIENISEKSSLSRDYKRALGSVNNYLTKVNQASKSELPNRWVHLAERTLMQRPLLHYAEFFERYEGEPINEKNRDNVQALDSIIDEINLMWNTEENARKMRKFGGPEYNNLKNLYDKAMIILEEGK